MCEGVREEGGRPLGRGQAARSRRPPSPPPWPTRTLFVSPPPRWSQIHARTSSTDSARPRSVSTMGRPPGKGSAAACRALGDNVLSSPRKRERAVVRLLLSHFAPPCIVAPVAAALATCPAHSCRPLPSALPPSPCPHVLRRRPLRAPSTCSALVIVCSPCSGAANPWATCGGAVPWHLCWHRPLPPPLPSGWPPLPPCIRCVAPSSPRLSMHPPRAHVALLFHSTAARHAPRSPARLPRSSRLVSAPRARLPRRTIHVDAALHSRRGRRGIRS